MTKSGAFCRALSVFALVLAVCMLFASCSVKPQLEVEGKKQDFMSMSSEELAKQATVGKYKDMTISLGDKTKEEAVWDAILKNTEIHEYPSEHVYYYMGQLEGQYRYYAEQAGVSYKEMLKQLGESETTILQDSKSMTKKDIAYAIIVKLENVSLTEDEKTAYFERYVEKYVENYGYGKEYVTSNMRELIYDSMLYDKTTELLILSNTFSE